MERSLMDKLTILADSAKYDVACTSSGVSRAARAGTIGSCYAPGCCHAFTADVQYRLIVFFHGMRFRFQDI